MMTENRNLLIAIILSAAVIFGWQYFVAGPQMKAEQAKQAAISHQEKKKPELHPQAKAPVVAPRTVRPAVHK